MSEATIRYESSELRLLLEISQALEGANDIADHLDTALNLMARHTGMMRGMLVLVSPDGRDMRIEAAYGLSKHELERGHYKPGEGVIGQVIATGRPMAVPKIAEEPLFLNRTGARDMHKDDISFLCVPIIVGGKVVGALSADKLFAHTVSLEEDMRLLQVLAVIIARAVRIRRDFNARHAAVVEENRRLQSMVRMDSMVGTSETMRRVIEEISSVAASGATVLIRGESGTGKELVASIIHANSPRSGRPFIKLNCAALPDNLAESELFGYERGAFTGAINQRKGRFEAAHGGTLFLDEVGDMSLMTQAKLLRAIQEKEFERIGGVSSIKVDVRFIAATNRNLEEMVARGAFRHDLYYRLSVFPIVLPPLRDRKDDMMALIAHFLQKLATGSGRGVERLSSEAAAALTAYTWPGNIRELENVLERAVILCGKDGVIQLSDLPDYVRGSVPGGENTLAAIPHHGGLDAALSELERCMLTQALQESCGNMARAAHALDISERVMGLRMKKYGLSYKTFRIGGK